MVNSSQMRSVAEPRYDMCGQATHMLFLPNSLNAIDVYRETHEILRISDALAS